MRICLGQIICLILLSLLVAPKGLLAQKKLTPSAKTGDGIREINLKELKKIQKGLKKVDYLSVNFSQSFFSPLRKKTRWTYGKAFFSKPSKFKWARLKPIPEDIIYDGKDLYIYKPSEKRALKFSSLGSQTKEIEKLSSIVLNVDRLLDFYDLKNAKYDSVNKVVGLEMTPKGKQEIERVSVKISLLRNIIKKVALSYRDGKIMTYEFKNPKHEKIDPNLFIFRRPPGVKLEVYD